LQLKPSECIAVEDSENGLQAARRAGLTTLITVNHYTRQQDFTGAAAVLSDLGEPDQGFTAISNLPATVGKSWIDTDTLMQLLEQS
jgi:beta-phosphoglucomutase-like phosphatase (HAD superfamily)